MRFGATHGSSVCVTGRSLVARACPSPAATTPGMTTTTPAAPTATTSCRVLSHLGLLPHPQQPSLPCCVSAPGGRCSPVSAAAAPAPCGWPPPAALGAAPGGAAPAAGFARCRARCHAVVSDLHGCGAFVPGQSLLRLQRGSPGGALGSGVHGRALAVRALRGPHDGGVRGPLLGHSGLAALLPAPSRRFPCTWRSCLWLRAWPWRQGHVLPLFARPKSRRRRPGPRRQRGPVSGVC